MSLKIAVLVPVKSGGSGGFQKHLARILARWLQNPKVAQIVLFAPEGALPELDELGVPVVRSSADDYRHGFRGMAAMVEASGVDVAFSTTSRPIELKGIPLVTMVRNVEPLQRVTYPASPLWRLRMWQLRRETTRACRQATRVLAVSQYTKSQIYSYLKLNCAVDVVYHGFDSADGAQPRRPANWSSTDPFFFAAGSIVPYRGYEDIIRAIGLLRRERMPLPRVVLAGTSVGLSRGYEKWVKRLPFLLGVQDHVIWIGHLHSEEMTWCFRESLAFLQTSRAESFSNIQVEAMGNGAPVISCDQPPMPEILGDAALYYPTGDAPALAKRMREILDGSQDQLSQRREQSAQRARHFSWDATASQTLDVLEQAIEQYQRSGRGTRNSAPMLAGGCDHGGSPVSAVSREGLRIAVLVPVKSGGSGGFAKHLMEVIPKWVTSREVKSVTMILPEELLPGLKPAGAVLEYVPKDSYRRGYREMRRLVESGNFDVALITTSRRLGIRLIPVVTMVQNVEPIQEARYRMPLLWRLRLAVLRRETKQACREADRVLTVSEYVKGLLASYAPSDKIDVVYHGSDPIEMNPAERPAGRVPDQPFLFAAGSIVPYRGYEDVLRAMAVLRTRTAVVPPLLIAGLGIPMVKSYEDELRQLVDTLGLGDRVTWLGLVSQRHMSWYYDNCFAFVQSSRAESFSNIQVEAMGRGAVVISCIQPPMPEILGNSALFYKVGDADGLADRIAEVKAMSPDQISTWRTRAKDRAARFSWDITASETLAVLQKALAEFHGGVCRD